MKNLVLLILVALIIGCAGTKHLEDMNSGERAAYYRGFSERMAEVQAEKEQDAYDQGYGSSNHGAYDRNYPSRGYYYGPNYYGPGYYPGYYNYGFYYGNRGWGVRGYWHGHR